MTVFIRFEVTLYSWQDFISQLTLFSVHDYVDWCEGKNLLKLVSVILSSVPDCVDCSDPFLMTWLSWFFFTVNSGPDDVDFFDLFLNPDHGDVCDFFPQALIILTLRGPFLKTWLFSFLWYCPHYVIIVSKQASSSECISHT